MGWLTRIIHCLFPMKPDAWREGDKAYRDGKSEDANPYPDGSVKRHEWRMGFKGLALLAALLLTQLAGCAGCRNDWKHMQSSFTGLDRKITLYAADGTPIREWETTAKVEDRGGTCYFLDAKGKAVTVSGQFVVEEL